MEKGPPDAIFGLVEAFKKDPRPGKISLAIGAYRDGDNKPFILPTVQKVCNDNYGGGGGACEYPLHHNTYVISLYAL